MDIQNPVPLESEGISLQMTYELSMPGEFRPAADSVIDVLKDTVGRVLVPLHTIHGVSKTVSRSNPQCAASVRYNAERIFGIKIDAQGTAELLITDLKDQILS